MNVFDLLIPAISQSLSGQNRLPGLIFAVVVTALIGLVVGRLWGRAWNTAWTPWRSAPSAIVHSAFMLIIFGSLLTLHSLSGERFGFASPAGIPNQQLIEDAIEAGDHKGLDARTALQQDGLFTPEIEFCWKLAESELPFHHYRLSDEIPTTADPHLVEQAKQLEQQHFMQRLTEIMGLYKPAYKTVLLMLFSSIALLMLTIAGMAYRAIPTIPIHPELDRYCSGSGYRA